MINLNGRLLKIAQMVDCCNKLADIGTDHAYIPIYLLQTGICKKVIATDIKETPLFNAEKNVNKYNLEGAVEFRLGEGIEPISDNECDIFIIAGMGGFLISEILKASLEKVKKARTIIMQPMYTDEVLRKFLITKGFKIIDEALVYEDKRIYVIIKATYDGIKRTEQPLYYHVGKSLFNKRDPLLKTQLERKIRIQSKITQGLEKSEIKGKERCIEEQEVLVQLKKAYATYYSE